MNGLDAIRARDASDIGWTTADGMGMWVAQLRVDVRALLAEVDRLEEGIRWLTADAASWRKAAEEAMDQHVASSARIHAAVAALPPVQHPGWQDSLDRAAVLAAIGAER